MASSQSRFTGNHIFSSSLLTLTISQWKTGIYTAKLAETPEQLAKFRNPPT